MAYKKKAEQQTVSAMVSRPTTNANEDFAADLVKQINKELGERVAYNLATDDAPTMIHNWTHTGSTQLDFIIANKSGGGLPEGRIIEIQGPPSGGKSHIAYECCKATQQQGGIVVYIDAEHATSVDNLKLVGIDIRNNFVFIEESCTENILTIIESTVIKARALAEAKKNIPVLVVWDSVAASSPKAELEGTYEQNTIGLQARVLSKGMRKIANVISDQKITLLLLNQQREKIGVLYGDPSTTPGGKAIPYHSSVRIKLTGGQQIKKTINGKEAVIGINVTAKTIKNKVARPWREVDFEIHFGKGIREEEQLFDALREYCEKSGKTVALGDKRLMIEGTGGWKTFSIADNKTGEVLEEVKFQKSSFGEKVLNEPKYKKYVDCLLEACFVMRDDDKEHITVASIDTSSAAEVEAAAIESEGL